MHNRILFAIVGAMSMAEPAFADKEQELAWMSVGMEAVKARLNDPNSAQFRNVYLHRGQKNTPFTCGEVNSKKGVGGYDGYQRFISGGSPDSTVFQEEISTFDSVWDDRCVK